MPRKKPTDTGAGRAGPRARTGERAGTPGIRDELLDELLAGYQRPEDLLGAHGLLKALTGALVTRAMNAELTHHLGYAPGTAPDPAQPNRRNGRSLKTLRTDSGPLTVAVPRDRTGSFAPQIVPKHHRHFNGFDAKIVSMYARGMSVRDIRAHLQEIYGVEVSAELISHVTDEVLDELRVWQQRPLEPVYLVVYLDALQVKIREQGVVRNRAVYLAVGLSAEGEKDVLGMWIQATEGAKFWLSILHELRERGVRDILILCADGLTGLPEAVEAVYAPTIFQTCVVHLVRSSTRLVPWKDRKAVCADLRQIYTAPSPEAAAQALEAFAVRWGPRFPMIAPAWRRRWAEVSPFLSFPAEIRRVIYTTNAIEALNRQLRKTLKVRGHLPSDDAALKLLYLAIRNAKKTWGQRDQRRWGHALLQFTIHFADRLPQC